MTIITNYLSFLFGLLANIKVPKPFRPLVYRVYSQICRVDLSAVPEDLKFYQTLGHFFTRDLKLNSRKIESDFVSPVDGYLRDVFVISKDQQIQVKGVSYQISKILTERINFEQFLGGSLFNLYLSPKDYHHVHAPVAGQVKKLIYVPGYLWPVNNFTYQRLPNLFARNERLIMEIESERGPLLLIMVGALNVGKMSVTFSDLVTNSNLINRDNRIQEIETSFACSIGSRLGTFHLGSSVVLITSPSFLQSFSNDVKWSSSGAVQLGNSLYQVS